MFISVTASWGVRCHVSFKVLTRISQMILQIFDVPSHFQESPVELQISCVFAFLRYKKRVKTHVLLDQSVHITHTYCCVSKLSKFGAYLYAVNDSTVVYINNTFFSLRNSP